MLLHRKIGLCPNRGVAQLVARDIWDVDAAGSNPVTPTKFLKALANAKAFIFYTRFLHEL